MKIFINRQAMTMADSSTLADAVQAFGAAGPFAVALNGQFVPRQSYPQQGLKEGDAVEILSPIEGG